MRLLVPGGEGALHYAKPRLKALFARMHLLPDRAAGVSLKCEVRGVSPIKCEPRGARVRPLLDACYDRGGIFFYFCQNRLLLPRLFPDRVAGVLLKCKVRGTCMGSSRFA